MKKVLVTGASGFVGRHVVNDLLERNIEVIATATSNKKASNLPWASKVNLIPFDLKDYSPETDYYTYFEKPEALIHLAWEGLPNYNSLFHIEENLFRHYGFIKNLILNGLKDITVAGTCLEYGFREGCLSEDVCTVPTTPYAVSKDCLRRFLEQLRLKTLFSFKWIRFFYMYGDGQNPNSLFSQLDRAINNNEPGFNMSGGEQVRDYLPVHLAAAYLNSCALQNNVTGIINCCSGRPVILKDLIMEYLQVKKKKINLNLGYYPYLDYEPMSFWGDNRKLKSILNQ